ncbi:hypothetical protein [Variovorax sp. EL159]|uniref:hypothetical protein n=1 Tax=Variovorax sp. EL159 TaxID=1566270 RepID=UPI00088A2591|nr:hypothetical protein [Variovorax sp. EL159]SCX73001.1 hypothetical protein SAMN03159363_4727 [Variovorax sp. EL159]
MHGWSCLVAGCLVLASLHAGAQSTQGVQGATQGADCTASASSACYLSFQPPQSGGALHYYASLSPDVATPAGPTRALIAMHGHPRDANKTFDAALQAVRGAGALADTLVVAPVFQVAQDKAGKCSTPGVPAAEAGDLLWTCGSWLEGGRAGNGNGITSFAAMDALVTELTQRWPSLRTVTIAGFSAGAQMVQHYIGFAQERQAGSVAVRYVVADPGTWLYFDPVRPQPMRDGVAVAWAACGSGADTLRNCTLTFSVAADGACPALNRWKYGTDALPASLGRNAAQARQRYAAADVSYLEGALDSSDAKGTYYGILDKSCAAAAQGPYRMQRGLAYAQYDRALLAPDKRREVVVVPGCAHDVACVFPSVAARGVLLGPSR